MAARKVTSTQTLNTSFELRDVHPSETSPDGWACVNTTILIVFVLNEWEDSFEEQRLHLSEGRQRPGWPRGSGLVWASWRTMKTKMTMWCGLKNQKHVMLTILIGQPNQDVCTIYICACPTSGSPLPGLLSDHHTLPLLQLPAEVAGTDLFLVVLGGLPGGTTVASAPRDQIMNSSKATPSEFRHLHLGH